ncbi:hypothetical protein AOQ84DRAFT_425652 [Glonium stellatum]|uniref:Caspase domain-containing protein n=1 Tax=Glonium stellatum TaxID=574774 RepID=A0A8E2F5J3_9PEZI|nr:hypothetical protein AOQ84DRAFT_425652 [Glonium stellatum]
MEKDIRDKELGDELDLMAEKGLVVLAILDCCYSGGATRDRRYGPIRCREARSTAGFELGYEINNTLLTHQNEWQLATEAVDPSMGLNFHFNNSSPSAMFNLKVGATGDVEVGDSRGQTLPEIPPLRVDGHDSPKEVVSVLRHLMSYNNIRDLKSPRDVSAPSYKLELVRLSPSVSEEPDVRASYRINFTNFTKQALYLTVPDLTPCWDVERIFPERRTPSQAVDPGRVGHEPTQTVQTKRVGRLIM